MTPLDYLTPDSDAGHWLHQFAEAVWASLPYRIRALNLVKASTEPFDTNTGGIYVEFATAFSGIRKVYLQLWLDQYLKLGQPAFCYCYYLKRTGYPALFARSMSKSLFRVKGPYQRDGGIVRLRSYRRTGILKTFTERSYSQYYFVGRFTTKQLPDRFTREPAKELTKEAAEFYRTTLSPSGQIVVENAMDVPVENDEFAGREGKQRTKIKIHKEVEVRSRRLATLAKTRDKYVCQVCGFDFSKVYPGVGDGFAEAHHIVPLASLSRIRLNRVDDLVTVCANCHRMLHRQDGMTVSTLKRIVKQGRALRK